MFAGDTTASRRSGGHGGLVVNGGNHKPTDFRDPLLSSSFCGPLNIPDTPPRLVLYTVPLFLCLDLLTQ